MRDLDRQSSKTSYVRDQTTTGRQPTHQPSTTQPAASRLILSTVCILLSLTHSFHSLTMPCRHRIGPRTIKINSKVPSYTFYVRGAQHLLPFSSALEAVGNKHGFIYIYRVSLNLWQFPGNWLQIKNYSRYSNFEANFEMPWLFTSGEVQKMTHSARIWLLKLLFFKATKKHQWNGCSSLISKDIGSFLEFLAFLHLERYQNVLNLTKKYHILDNFCTPVLSSY